MEVRKILEVVKIQRRVRFVVSEFLEEVNNGVELFFKTII